VSYPQGPGQPGENPYPQYSGGPTQPGAPQYPQPPYPPTPAYPPQYSQPPYGQQPNPAQYAAPATPVKETNFYAGRALVYGAVIFVLSIVLIFLGRPLVGIIAAYTIYLGIRGLTTAASLRTHPGVVQSVIGLILGALALLISVAAYTGILGALLGTLLGG
jgi:hypothetical protein